MNLEYFKHFLRANYTEAASLMSAKEIEETGKLFKDYLKDKFKGKLEKLEPIWDINLTTVIPQFGSPIRYNGYHPALIIHFEEFIKKTKE